MLVSSLPKYIYAALVAAAVVRCVTLESLRPAEESNANEEKRDDVESFMRFVNNGIIFSGTYKGEHYLVGLTQAPNQGPLVDCGVISGRDEVSSALERLPKDAVTATNEDDIVVLLVACANFLIANGEHQDQHTQGVF
ncbi:uncharacterized protein LOC135383315 [Ornithodoros turicata]|uniref:uncharacterized protein LOC135383315 n=1 Tax=Ornithodoros turicata TaxID=34597 RepID=UPI0031389F8B